MHEVFFENLETVQMKMHSLSLLDKEISKLKIKIKEAKNYHQEYWLKDNLNDLVRCMVNIYFSLKEYNLGIDCFQKNYIEENREAKEYIILEILETWQLDELWIKEYERHKIDYRDTLKERYEELKKIYK